MAKSNNTNQSVPGYPNRYGQPAAAITYQLNGSQVGRGNTLNIVGNGITAVPGDDKMTFYISAGGGGDVTSVNGDIGVVVVHDVFDGADAPSLDGNLRSLYDPSGNLAISYSSRSLRTTGGVVTVYDWGTNIMYATDGSETVDHDNRMLKDNGGNTVADWQSGQLIDSFNATISVNWRGRTLNDNGNAPALDYQNRTLKIDSDVILNWNSQIANDSSADLSIDWDNRELSSSIGNVTINWEARVLSLANGIPVLDWGTQTFKDAAGATMGTWTHGLKSRVGITADRPTLGGGDAGVQYFDTTLVLPIWWNGTQWIDAAGNVV